MPFTLEAAPLDEVVVGRVFQPLPLSVGHVGRFWDLIQDDFPTCANQQPIVDSESGQVFQLFVGAPPAVTPRAWFTSPDESRLMQLQHDRFYFNWRQNPAQSQPYIRFNNIFEEYVKYSEIASSFAVSQLGVQPVTQRLDLNYVNLFRQGVEWNDFSDLKKIFRFGKFLDLIGDSGAVKSIMCRFELEMHGAPGRLVVSFGSSVDRLGKPVIRMELIASCEAGALGEASEFNWFHLAHEAIISSFSRLTTEEMQSTIWRRVE